MTKERAHYLLQRSFEMGDELIRLDAKTFTVKSSKGNEWYDIDGTGCECKGFQTKRECRHFVRRAYILQGEPVIEGMPETGWYPGCELWGQEVRRAS